MEQTHILSAMLRLREASHFQQEEPQGIEEDNEVEFMTKGNQKQVTLYKTSDSEDNSNEQQESTHEIENDLQQQHDQLQDDVQVLVLHLEQQRIEMEKERKMMQNQLQQTKQSMEEQIHSLSLENEALKRQNLLLTQEREKTIDHEILAKESHEELILALKTQQQREEQARTIISNLLKERDVLKKQVGESKTYSRKLEEEVVTLRAEVQHFQLENQHLVATTITTATMKKDRDEQWIREQALVIESLRADQLQMEFEYKTLLADKDRLTTKLATLQRQKDHTNYDVISLTTCHDTKHKSKTKKKLSVVTHRQDGGGFSDLMALPNSVQESPIGSSSKSLVSKTISSAKKKLFQSSPRTVVLPH